MKVEVRSDGKIVWSYGEGQGEDNTSYRKDGTYNKINDALQKALEQIQGQLRLKVTNIVSDVSGTPR
jgi:hypothetical protein